MATIIDVAREAGVSKSTVSRVLNRTGPVKAETKAAIDAAMKKLEYSPSYFAQGIRTGRTHTIAMLVPEYSNIFYSEMFQGAEDVALKNGYMVLVCNTERSSTSELEYTRALIRRRVDGIIYNTYENNPKMVEFLKDISRNIPVVFMNRVFSDPKDFSYVCTDGFNSTRKAVQYLYQRGKRKIGYIRNVKQIDVVNERYEGYLMGLKECGLPYNEKWIHQEECRNHTSDYIKLGCMAGSYFAGLDDRPDAVLASVDLIALGCVKQLKECQVQVPKDINVVGFDNLFLDEIYEPALTTIGQPIRELGRHAAQIIISKINGNPVNSQVLFDGKLILRGTTD